MLWVESIKHLVAFHPGENRNYNYTGKRGCVVKRSASLPVPAELAQHTNTDLDLLLFWHQQVVGRIRIIAIEVFHEPIQVLAMVLKMGLDIVNHTARLFAGLVFR